MGETFPEPSGSMIRILATGELPSNSARYPTREFFRIQFRWGVVQYLRKKWIMKNFSK